MAVATSSSSPTVSSCRPSRQTVEEELWLLRSRCFVKSESRRLNSLSPRYSHTNEEEFRKRPTRRWRRRRGVGRRGDNENNNQNFVERMRDAARKARVFQLRISGGRSWWPSSMHHTPTATARRIDVDKKISCLPPNRCDELVLKRLALTNIEVDRGAKNFKGPKPRPESNTQKLKFEWNTLWKNKHRSHDQSETATVIEECVDVDTSMNTTLVDQGPPETLEIDNENFEKEQRNKKNRQNIIVAAVATTSVSSLGAALAIILL